jgi:hypothetical protein
MKVFSTTKELLQEEIAHNRRLEVEALQILVGEEGDHLQLAEKSVALAAATGVEGAGEHLEAELGCLIRQLWHLIWMT